MKKMQIKPGLIVALLFTTAGQSWADINAADYCEDMRAANRLSYLWAQSCEETIRVQEKYRKLNEADNRQKESEQRRYEEFMRKSHFSLELIEVDIKLGTSISTEEREKLLLRRATLCSMEIFMADATRVKWCAEIPQRPPE